MKNSKKSIAAMAFHRHDIEKMEDKFGINDIFERL